MKKRFTLAIAAMLALCMILSACGTGANNATTAAATAATAAATTTAATTAAEKTTEAATTAATTTAVATTATSATTAASAAVATEAAAAGDAGIEVTMMVTGHPVIIDWSTNKMSMWMEEKTGIKVNYKTIPQAGRLEALSLELSSGAYPDAFMAVGMNLELATRYGVAEGRLLALNDLLDKHAPNLQEIFKANPGYKGLMTMVDGNIYCMPEVNQCQHCSMHNKFWINVAFLEAVGKPMPVTTDDLVDVLKAFRDEDPNGNGQKDEIPLIGAMRDGWGNTPEYFIMNAFTFYDANLLANASGYPVLGLYRDGDTVKTPWAEPDFIEGLKFMRMLVDEGLLYEGSFTAESNAMVNLVEGGDDPRVGAVVAGHGYMFCEVGGPRYAQFRGLMPLQGPKGRREIRKNIYDIGYNGFYISADSPHAVELVKWADLLYTFEATATGYFGPEGTHWRRAEPGEMGLDGKPAIYYVIIPWNETEPHNDHWIQQCISYRSAAFRAGEVYQPGDPDSQAAFEKRLYDTTEEMEKWANTLSVMPPVKFTVEQNNVNSIPMTDLNNLIKQYIPGFISGAYNIDTEYEGFLKMLDDMGLKELVASYQEAYDQQWAGK